MFCLNCGGELESTGKFCGHCGFKLIHSRLQQGSPKECPKCGVVNSHDAAKCDCGHSFIVTNSTHPDMDVIVRQQSGLALFRLGALFALIAGSILLFITIGLTGISAIIFGGSVLVMVIGLARAHAARRK